MACGQAAKGGARLGANLRGADVDMQAGEQVEGRRVSGGVAEGVAAELDLSGLCGIWLRGFGADGEACGERGGEVGERLAGARGDDERSDEGDFRTAMPLAEAVEGVGSNEAEERAAAGEFGAQTLEGVDGEVGPAGGGGCVHERDGKGGLVGDGEAGHGDAVGKTGGGAVRLERLCADGREEHGVKLERVARGAGHGEMAAMGRVKTASEKGYATALDCRIGHGVMVMPAG